MKHLYGPVPSRRLGRSLGIDPFTRKRCTHNCIYCQLGSSQTVAADIAVAGAPLDEVEFQIKQFFEQGGTTDYITFSGSGEPTLWKHFEELTDFIKENFSDSKLAVITNGTTLWREDICRAACTADLVVPTISAADENTYKKLHRPDSNAEFRQYISGLMHFASEFHNEVWAEVMLVAGVNDNASHLHLLAQLLDEICPSYIDINLPVRPPAEKWVVPPEANYIESACEILGEKCRIVGKFVSPPGEAQKLANMLDRVLQIIVRRPETAKHIAEALSANIDDIQQALRALEEKKLVIPTENGYFKLAREK